MKQRSDWRPSVWAELILTIELFLGYDWLRVRRCCSYQCSINELKVYEEDMTPSYTSGCPIDSKSGVLKRAVWSRSVVTLTSKRMTADICTCNSDNKSCQHPSANFGYHLNCSEEHLYTSGIGLVCGRRARVWSSSRHLGAPTHLGATCRRTTLLSSATQSRFTST